MNISRRFDSSTFLSWPGHFSPLIKIFFFDLLRDTVVHSIDLLVDGTFLAAIDAIVFVYDIFGFAAGVLGTIIGTLGRSGRCISGAG